MKQTTKNILGVGAIILLSSGVAGLTTYKLLQSNDAAKETSFNEMFQQNPNVKLAAFDAVNAQPVDLTQAAENSLHAVVHIKSTQEAKTRTVQQAPDILTSSLETDADSSVRYNPSLVLVWFRSHHFQRRIYRNQQSRN